MQTINGPASSVASLDIGPNDWPQWRFDAGRGAVTTAKLPKQLHLMWTRQLPAPRPAWPASQPWLRFDESYTPVAAGKMLYVPSMVDDSVTAYDTESGKQRWRFYTDGPVRFAPIAAGGNVFFGSDDGHLYCVDGKDGTLKWRFRGGPSDRKVLGNERLISTWPVRGGPVLQGGTIYFTAGIWPFMGIFVHGIDAVTGEALWTNSGEGATYTTQPHGSPAFAGLAPRGHLVATNDTLVVPGGRTQPGCYELATGKFRDFQFGDKGQGSYHVTARNDCYFISGKVVRISGEGSVIGRYAQLHNQNALYSIEGDSLLAQDTTISQRTVDETDKRGNTTSATEQVLKEQWKTSLKDAPGRLFLKAGARFFAGEEGRVVAIEAGAGDEKGKIVWDAKFKGRPWSMLAADHKLFVVTEQGTIYCFGEGTNKPKVYDAEPVAMADVPQAAVAEAQRAIEASGASAGIGLVFGLGDGQLADALVAESNLQVIAVDADAEKVEAFRQRMTDAGLYGTRVSAHVGDPVGYPWPPYMANVVVSGDINAVGKDRGELLLKSIFNTLRPYGGTACLQMSAKSLQPVVDKCNLEGSRLTADGEAPDAEDRALLVRDGALPGAADWTHNYADAGNSIVSQDDRVKLPLGLLWFGGPSNDEILPRHGHGPSPQVAAGRLFIEGPDMLRALDIYTGRLMWQKELPGLGKFYANTGHQPGATEIGSNYVSREDAVYVVYGPSLLKLNAEMGQTEDEFRLGDTPDGSPSNWGHIASWEDLLIATSTPVEVVDEESDDEERHDR